MMHMEMAMYAVIKTGGKQYKVSEGEFLKVEKLVGEIGDKIEFAEVLMIGGEKIAIGAPVVAGASVTAKIAAQGKDKKILVFKSKRRKGTRKLRGHRQHKTVLKIEKISA
jgi:large subunit ribosomal protein L21